MLTNLARKYGDQVDVVSFYGMETNNEPPGTKDPKYVRKVEKYVSDKANRMKYTVAVDDPQKTMEVSWLRAAGFSGLPKTFVVDKEGFIAWTGSDMRKVDQLVQEIIEGNYSLAAMTRIAREKEAKLTPYDKEQPLLIDGNGGKDTDFLFRSILTEFKGDIKTGRSEFIPGNRNRVREIGADLYSLYWLAHGDTLMPYPMYSLNSYGKYWRKPILAIKDTTGFQFDYKSPENRWNYSLILPEKTSAKLLQQAMQRDLKTYFGYDVTVETREMPCWILTATKKAKKYLVAKNPEKEYNLVDDEFMGASITHTKMKNIIRLLWSKN